jgi:TonB family protein
MKYLACAVAFAALLTLNSPASSAQVGRRAGSSGEIAVPVELPPPPDAVPADDLQRDEVADCDCLRRAAADGRAQEDGASSEPAKEEQAFRSNEVDVKAVVTYAPDPVYTREAREMGTSGRVVLRVVLGASGKVSTVRVVEGLPDGLTANAVSAACHIEFRPAQKGGQAVSQYATVEFNFDVDGRRYGRDYRVPPTMRVPSRTGIPLPRMPYYLPAPRLFPAPPWRLTPFGCNFVTRWL